MKRVIMAAMIEPYPENLIKPGDEVWCCNAAFRHQKGVTRVYTMDDLQYFPDGYAEEIALLPSHVKVYSTRHWPEIPRSEPYPIHEVLARFNGHRYFVCTMAYMLAHAIFERFDEIVLSGCYWAADSAEYMMHKSCMDFWAGWAGGSGVNIDIYGPCSLCRPFVWEPPLYGYQTNRSREVIQRGLAAGYIFASNIPCQPVVHVNVDDPDFAGKYGRPETPERVSAGELDRLGELLDSLDTERTRVEQQIRIARSGASPSLKLADSIQ